MKKSAKKLFGITLISVHLQVTDTISKLKIYTLAVV